MFSSIHSLSLGGAPTPPPPSPRLLSIPHLADEGRWLVRRGHGGAPIPHAPAFEGYILGDEAEIQRHGRALELHAVHFPAPKKRTRVESSQCQQYLGWAPTPPPSRSRTASTNPEYTSKCTNTRIFEACLRCIHSDSQGHRMMTRPLPRELYKNSCTRTTSHDFRVQPASCALSGAPCPPLDSAS